MCSSDLFSVHETQRAVVAVAEARFADSLPLAQNAFGGAKLTLLGSGLTLGINYWADAAARPADKPYCIDRRCSLLAPIVDGAHPSSVAYTSLAQAVADGATHIIVTASAPVGGSVEVLQPGTVIEGALADGCADVPTLEFYSAADGVVSAHGALSRVAHLRLSLAAGAEALRYDGTPAGAASVAKEADRKSVV